MAQSNVLQPKSSGALKKEKSTHSYPIDFIDRILYGDAVELLKQIPDGAVDIVITSPPYNLKNSTGNGMKDGRGGKWAMQHCKRDSHIITIACRTMNMLRGN